MFDADADGSWIAEILQQTVFGKSLVKQLTRHRSPRLMLSAKYHLASTQRYLAQQTQAFKNIELHEKEIGATLLLLLREIL